MIYENIKAICESKNISISALEKKAELGNGTIGKWRTCDPNIESLRKVAAALDVSINRLMRE